jgi:hypothetical protein
MLAVVGLATGGTAKAEDKKDGEKGIKFDTKAEKYQGAATTDFGEKLGLSYPSLLTLGTRIELARRDADPVGLMAVACELGVAEKVSGKQAELTADALKKEASGLATMRQHSVELKAVALMTVDADAKAKLETAATEAAKQEVERPKGILDQLIMDNDSHHTVNVYVNGNFVGHVHPHSHAHFHVHTHGHTDLEARGGGHVWRRHFDRDYENYTWRIWEN